MHCQRLRTLRNLEEMDLKYLFSVNVIIDLTKGFSDDQSLSVCNIGKANSSPYTSFLISTVNVDIQLECRYEGSLSGFIMIHHIGVIVMRPGFAPSIEA